MRRLISFAIKNLARYKRRTILTASAVAVGIAIFIFIDGWLLGAELESDRNIVWYETSSAKVMHPDYWEERDRLPLSIVIENPQSVVETLEGEGIPSAPRTVFFADLVVWQDPFEEDGSMPVRVFALDPERDDDVFRFRDTVKEGRYLESGEEGVMIGTWLAEDLGAEVGFPVALVTRTREGYFQTIDAEVVAILDVPNPYVNRSSVFMDLSASDYYLQMDGAVTEINLSFPGLDNADEKAGEVASVLEASGFDLEVKSWRAIASAYGALTEAKQAGTGMIMLLLFIIATVGISNTMLMAVYERTSEIGMLRAIGMKDRDIRFAFMIEAAGIGVLGSVIGILFGVISNFYMVNVGIDFTWMIRDIDIGYRSAGVMYGAWNPGTMVQAFFTGIIICFVVALIPTRRAMKMKITDCLRNT